MIRPPANLDVILTGFAVTVSDPARTARVPYPTLALGTVLLRRAGLSIVLNTLPRRSARNFPRPQ